jgi:hypothetical protein
VIAVLDHIPAAPSVSAAAATATMPPLVLFPQLRRLCFERPFIDEEFNDFTEEVDPYVLALLIFATRAGPYSM